MHESTAAFLKDDVDLFIGRIGDETETELRMFDRIGKRELGFHIVGKHAIGSDLSFQLVPHRAHIGLGLFGSFLLRAGGRLLRLCLLELERALSSANFALHFCARRRRVRDNDVESLDGALLTHQMDVAGDSREFGQILRRDGVLCFTHKKNSNSCALEGPAVQRPVWIFAPSLEPALFLDVNRERRGQLFGDRFRSVQEVGTFTFLQSPLQGD